MINMKFDMHVKKNKEIYSNNEIFKILSQYFYFLFL